MYDMTTHTIPHIPRLPSLSSKSALFPFALFDTASKELFRKYVSDNRENIVAKYGHNVFTGGFPSNRVKEWGYYEVLAVVTSASTVEFTTYNMACPIQDGRGKVQETIPAVYAHAELLPLIFQEQQRMARYEYERREKTAKLLAREAGVEAIRQEMFPEE